MFGVAASTELPADILMILTVDRFGRRWMSCLTMSLSGFCAFMAAAVHDTAQSVEFVMAMLSRFWINVAFNIGLQYASELLPTVIRGQGVNVIHMIGYVAALISPVIAQIGHHHPVLSLTLLGGLSLFGGILSLFLSETLGEVLPNNLEEAESFGKHQRFWNCPIYEIWTKRKQGKVGPAVFEPEVVVVVVEDQENEEMEEEIKKEKEDLKQEIRQIMKEILQEILKEIKQENAEKRPGIKQERELKIIDSKHEKELKIIDSKHEKELKIIDSKHEKEEKKPEKGQEILEETKPENGENEEERKEHTRWANSLHPPVRGEEYKRKPSRRFLEKWQRKE